MSVDLSEVELIENENGPRENHSALLDVSFYLANYFAFNLYIYLVETRYDQSEGRGNWVDFESALQWYGKRY